MFVKAGVDLGTASIGFMVWGVNDGLYEPLYHEVRIFKEPAENTQSGMVMKTVQRRDARQARRQQKRYSRRMNGLKNLGVFLGLSKCDIAGRRSIYLTELRADAAQGKIELKDFFHVLIRIAKRRGYAGGFTKTLEGDVAKGASELQERMNALAESKGVPSVTLGQFIHHHYLQGNPTYLKAQVGLRNSFDDEARTALFALREMVIDEFNTIWDEQAKHHEVLNKIIDGRALKSRVFDAIFFQRPLKAPRAMVSPCIYEPTLARAPCAHPAYQTYRIETLIANLRWGGGKRAERLTVEQAQFVRDILNGRNDKCLGKVDGVFNIKDVLKALKDANLHDPMERTLNVNGHGRETIVGNTTITRMRYYGWLDDWRRLESKHQTGVINLLADIGDPALFMPSDWHKNLLKDKHKQGQSKYRTIPDEVVLFIEKMKATKKGNGEDAFDRLSKMEFSSGRASYSIKALNNLNQWFVEAWAKGIDVISDYHAQQDCYGHRAKTKADTETMSRMISSPPKTGNAVVDVALRELKGVLQRFSDTTGHFIDEIVVEMNREVGLGIKARNDLNSQMRFNEKTNGIIRKALSELHKAPTPSNIRRYKLWEEQQNCCPYCAGKISVRDALDGSVTNYEHIIPRSLTQVGLKQSEIILAHASCNHEKGNRTPFDAFGHDETRWDIIQNRAKSLIETASKLKGSQAYNLKRKAELLRIKDYEIDVMTDESIADFADRQFHQTSWISKTATQWLKEFIPAVYPTSGRFTAKLRHQWGLNTIIPATRIKEGLSVSVVTTDINGNEVIKPIDTELFKKHRTFWEGKGDGIWTADQLYKRNDHRHHLIDAITISLMSRSMFIQMIKESQRKGDDTRHLSAPLPMPHPSLYVVAEHMIENTNISHKPDRHIEGGFFQDTIYSRDKNLIARIEADGGKITATTGLCKKTTILDLKGNSESATRDNINRIVSEQTKFLILNAFNERIASGISWKEALTVPVFNPVNQNYISKVKLFASPAGQPIEQDSHLYISDGYAYLDVWSETIIKNGKEKLESKSELVSIYDAHLRRSNKNILCKDRKRFFIGDTILDKKTGSIEVIRQLKMEGPTILLQHLTDISEPKKLRKVSGKRLADIEVIDNVRASDPDI